MYLLIHITWRICNKENNKIGKNMEVLLLDLFNARETQEIRPSNFTCA